MIVRQIARICVLLSTAVALAPQPRTLSRFVSIDTLRQAACVLTRGVQCAETTIRASDPMPLAATSFSAGVSRAFVHAKGD